MILGLCSILVRPIRDQEVEVLVGCAALFFRPVPKFRTTVFTRRFMSKKRKRYYAHQSIPGDTLAARKGGQAVSEIAARFA